VYKKKAHDYIQFPILPEELRSRVKLNLHYYRYNPIPKKNITQQNTSTVFISTACHYILKNLDKKLTLDGIAIALGTNRSRLAADFKTVLGITVFDWLREQRLLKAKSIIISTDISVQNIALTVGFENAAHFSTLYKRYFNVSPMQHRKLLTQRKG